MILKRPRVPIYNNVSSRTSAGFTVTTVPAKNVTAVSNTCLTFESRRVKLKFTSRSTNVRVNRHVAMTASTGCRNLNISNDRQGGMSDHGSKVPCLKKIVLGDLHLDQALILAPMAGVTTPVFRQICREYGAKLTISEMLHARLYLENDNASSQPRFGQERPRDTTCGNRNNDGMIRSVQIYGTEAEEVGESVSRLIERDRVHHVDLNFGCPMPKVIKRGGGAAVPGDSARLLRITRAAVQAAKGTKVGITAKMRLGVNRRLTYMDAAYTLCEAGVSAITIHTRTAEQRYDRDVARRNWWRIRELKESISGGNNEDVKIFGNGDVFSAEDATEMMRCSNADGVVVGRGALGRPWLFRDLETAFRRDIDEGSTADCSPATVPEFNEVRNVMLRHLTEEIKDMIESLHFEERDAVRNVRKWIGWYWQGYVGLPEGWVKRLCKCETLSQLQDTAWSFDGAGVRVDRKAIFAPRGKVTSSAG